LLNASFTSADGLSAEEKRGLDIIQPHAPHPHAVKVLFSIHTSLGPSGSLQGTSVLLNDYALDFLNFAHRALCAAAILALLFADIFRRLRIGLPPYTLANAVSAAFKPDNCFSTRSRSCFNCFIIEDRFGIVLLGEDCNREMA
jgi:hypothetical protein